MNPTAYSPADEVSTASRRLHLLDMLRGLNLIDMILYHFMWNLVYIAAINLSWYKGQGAHVWQQSICWTFILLSGFCWSFGRHPFKRGLTVFLAGGLVTAVTLVFIPENRIIFGVLTLIGSCMLLMILLDKFLRKITNPIAVIVLTALFGILFLLFLPVNRGHLANFAGIFQGKELFVGGPTLPKTLYHGWLNTYLGFPAAGFYSTDYFPLLPWFFLFVTGYLLHRLCSGCNLGKVNLLESGIWRKNPLPWAAFIGRHSLLIYLLHQPVLYSITLIIIQLRQYTP